MSGAYVLVYTADEEEPLCERCDNVNESDSFCCTYCGAQHGWNGYCRTVDVTNCEEEG